MIGVTTECKRDDVTKLHAPLHLQSFPPPSQIFCSKPLILLTKRKRTCHQQGRVKGQGRRGERPTGNLPVSGPGTCSSVTPAGSGRSPAKVSYMDSSMQVNFSVPEGISASPRRLWSAAGRYPAGSVLPAITCSSTAAGGASPARGGTSVEQPRLRGLTRCLPRWLPAPTTRSCHGRANTRTWGIEATAVLYPASPLETSVSGPP